MKKQNNKRDKDPKHNKEFEIIVNGKKKTWDKKEISFKEVVILAFGSYDENPLICYTVTYKRAHGNKPQGSLVEGESVKVKKGMIFNVTRTDKS